MKYCVIETAEGRIDSLHAETGKVPAFETREGALAFLREQEREWNRRETPVPPTFVWDENGLTVHGYQFRLDLFIHELETNTSVFRGEHPA